MSKIRELVLVLFLGSIAGLIAEIFFDRSICLFINMFGIPCPACGITRAYISFLKLNIEEAFRWHPCFWCVPFFIFGVKRKKVLYLLGSLFILVWIVRMYLYFPYIPPMKFNEKALYIWMFHKIKNNLMY